MYLSYIHDAPRLACGDAMGKDAQRAARIAWCAPCQAMKAGICGEQCSACRKARRHRSARAIACTKCKQPVRTYYALPQAKGAKLCERCRAVHLLVRERRVLLNYQATPAQRSAWVARALTSTFAVDVLIVWHKECLFVLVRLICWVRFGRALALLDPVPTEDAAAVAEFLVREVGERRAPVVVLGATEARAAAIAAAMKGAKGTAPYDVRGFTASISKQGGLLSGFSVEGFLANPRGFDGTAAVRRAAEILAAAGVEPRGPKSARSEEFARYLYP